MYLDDKVGTLLEHYGWHLKGYPEITSVRHGFLHDFDNCHKEMYNPKTREIFINGFEDVIVWLSLSLNKNQIFSFFEFVRNILFKAPAQNLVNSFIEYLFLHRTLSFLQDESKIRLARKRIHNLDKKWLFSSLADINTNLSTYLLECRAEGAKPRAYELIKPFESRVEYQTLIQNIDKHIQNYLDKGKVQDFNHLSKELNDFLQHIYNMCIGANNDKSLLFKTEGYAYRDLGYIIQNILILRKPLNYKTIKIRTRTLHLDDQLRPSRSGRCTAGNGQFNWVSYAYYFDSSIDILEIIAQQDSLDEEKIGDVVLVRAEDSAHNKYLVVETIEAYYPDLAKLSKIINLDWRELIYYSILKAAERVGISSVIFNINIDHKPVVNEMLFYVAAQNSLSYEDIAKTKKKYKIDPDVFNPAQEGISVPFYVGRRFRLDVSESEFRRNHTFNLNKIIEDNNDGLTYLSAWSETKDDDNFICDQENKHINNGQGIVFGIKVDVRKALKSRRRKHIMKLTRVKEYKRPEVQKTSSIMMYGH